MTLVTNLAGVNLSV